jgi:hypothetical protein
LKSPEIRNTHFFLTPENNTFIYFEVFAYETYTPRFEKIGNFGRILDKNNKLKRKMYVFDTIKKNKLGKKYHDIFRFYISYVHIFRNGSILVKVKNKLYLIK